ncbi:hypothetical protein CYY_006614 [Polysphondylium violaceum]|uniref:Uncharacterized protein n=1 Tax=Polysphondylium violaceum TaxID=133409 RepID=A0A8J4PQD3_9MYCE|nr:hypothetical protein CYY_006614 [Polysphondylium violaceum]
MNAIDYLFFGVFRNPFLKNIVSQYRCANASISVSLDYLRHNAAQLSRLDRDTFKIGILVALENENQVDEYLALSQQDRDLITQISVSHKLPVAKEQQLISNLPCKIRAMKFNAPNLGNFGSITQLDTLILIDDPRFPIDLEQISFPPNLKTLYLCACNEAIKVDEIPQSLEHISIFYPNDNPSLFNMSRFPKNAVKPLTISLTYLSDFLVWPVFSTEWNLKSISFGVALNSTDLLVPNMLPNTVETLSLLHFPGELQAGVIPQSVTSLKIDHYRYELQVGILPTKLKSLTAGAYNQPIREQVLPNTLTFLKMNNFNHPLHENLLPASLVTLSMRAYNQPLSFGNLPNLATCTLASLEREIGEGQFPNSITSLSIRHSLSITSSACFPTSLKHLEIFLFNATQGYLSLIPSHVESLTLNSYIIGTTVSFDDVHLPQHITKLKICAIAPPIPSTFLPQTLKKLIIPSSHVKFEKPKTSNDSDDCIYPPTLEYLSVPSPKTGTLPKSLRTLTDRKGTLQHF